MPFKQSLWSVKNHRDYFLTNIFIKKWVSLILSNIAISKSIIWIKLWKIIFKLQKSKCVKFIGVKLYRLQAHNSITLHLYIILCIYHPKWNFLLSPFMWPTSPILLPPQSPCPLGKTPDSCLSMSFCLYVCSFIFF